MQLAVAIRTRPTLRKVFSALFDAGLRAAERWNSRQIRQEMSAGGYDFGGNDGR